MSSNSVILTEILNSENSEWREAMLSFMESKTKEFQAIMKATVEKTMTDKISSFYNRSFDNHETILFDVDPGDIGKKCIASLQTQIGHNPDKNALNVHKLKIKTIEGNVGKCFVLDPVRESHNQQRRRFYVFKNFIIIQIINGWQGATDNYEFYNHLFPTDMLFALKHFQIKDDYNCIHGMLKIYNEHPEYFKQNCSEFESICKREYEEIQKQKDNLKQLVDENTAKIDYYRSLDEQIKWIDAEKLAIEEEKAKLNEQKTLLAIAKQKISAMKTDAERERLQLEEEKAKFKAENFDMDKFLEE
jgi:hypothetical protein